ncbi:LysR family transcriptional regulator [Vibrio sp. SCSIO 43136]|uniref:LysR family transcriptional regulator n=1 Tax=Vibrio sp. SCSIO 43136 TaxID=2819101 RepID=UPI0020755A53|nr:LysR family transcriptional regulator [Vibrio sp. SCSIO 43136]USD67309.1 LysR family transcriptional regulator [Vibrio sp. SCSIO 43136]
MNRVHRYFLMVARTGNIKKAAEQLYVTQPALTSAIKKLEADMGVPLLIRRSKGVDLTEYGEVFLRYVEEEQDKHLTMMHSIQDMYQREQGKLKVGVGEVWWELFARHSITQYQQQNPNSSLYLEFGNNLALMYHLIQGDIDLLIGHEVTGLKESIPVTFRPLLNDREAIFVREGHPLLTQCEKNIADFPVIRITPAHQRHHSVLNSVIDFTSEIQKGVSDTSVVYQVDSLLASLDLLKATDAIMPYSDCMQAWMKKNGIELLSVNHERVGNVGIYHKRQLEDQKTLDLIDKMRTSVEMLALKQS